MSDPLSRPGLRFVGLLVLSGALLFATYMTVKTYECPVAYGAYGIGVVLGLALGHVYVLRKLATIRRQVPQQPWWILAKAILAIVLGALFLGVLGYLKSLPLPCELEASIPALLGSIFGSWVLYQACFFLWVRVTGFCLSGPPPGSK